MKGVGAKKKNRLLKKYINKSGSDTLFFFLLSILFFLVFTLTHIIYHYIYEFLETHQVGP